MRDISKLSHVGSKLKKYAETHVTEEQRKNIKEKKKGSKGEQFTRAFLKRHNIRFIEQKTFDYCINEKTGRKLPFDFYLPTYKVILEIDGTQHQEAVNWSGHMTEEEVQSAFNENKRHDEIKTNYCLSHKIKLFRIVWNGNHKQLNNDLNKTLREITQQSAILQG